MKTSSFSRWTRGFIVFVLVIAVFGLASSARATPGSRPGLAGLEMTSTTPEPTPGIGISGGGFNITPPVIPIQGKLADAGGAPISGARTLMLSLYDNEIAIDAICAELVPVTVINGLFNALLQTCSAQQIFGERLWLGIQVQGEASEMTPRQPVYAVPYAVSLVPGANVTQSSSSAYTLNLTNTAGADVLQMHSEYGDFINALSTLEEARFTVKNGGEVWSKAESKVMVSPLNGVTEIPNSLVLTPKDYNSLWVRSTAIGNKTVFIPVDAPMTLYGSPLKVTGARVCYVTENAANYILSTEVRMIYEEGAYIPLASDSVPRNVTGSIMTCYNLTLSAGTNISGPLMFYFNLHFANAIDSIRIGAITLTLANQ